jgi:hypothetical protein
VVDEDLPQEAGAHPEGLQHGLDGDALLGAQASGRRRRDRAGRGQPGQLAEDVHDVLAAAAFQLLAFEVRRVPVERLLRQDPCRHLGRQRGDVVQQAATQTSRCRAQGDVVHA